MTGPGQVEVWQVSVADPEPSEVLVRVQFSGISPGTELRCLAGDQPMAVFPFVPGYSAAGVVIKAGRDSGLTEGDRVFAAGGKSYGDVARLWGGHSELLLQDGRSVVRIPNGVASEDAALTKPAAIAFHGYRLARFGIDQKVAVIGLGLIGQISARLFRSAAQHIACDVDPDRVRIACDVGIDARVIDRDLQPLIGDHADWADAVVDVTGVPSVLDRAIALLRARPWGDVELPIPTYLVQGSYPDAVRIPYQAAFMKEASFVLARDNGKRDLDAVLDAMACGTLHLSDLRGFVVTPERAMEAYSALRRRGGILTALIDWR